MRNTFKILFYVKRNAPLRNGTVPIMCRITIGGQRVQLSAQLSVNPDLWDVRLGRASGRSPAAVRVNERLVAMRSRLERCYDTLFAERMSVTPPMIKEMYLGIDCRCETLLAFFRQHNEEFRRMVGLNRSKSTYYKYRCVCGHLETYISRRYHRRDLMFKELDREFLTGFHAYIAQECSFRKNTVWIYLIALKHILMLAHGKGYLSSDLFADYRLHSEFVARNYLTVREINRMMRLSFESGTLRLVRDAFLFSCFTGLSYIDLSELTRRNIRRDENRLWIATTRRKTGTDVHIRLFAVSYAILVKYMPASDGGRIFDLPSNGWCNHCLDEIRRMAQIPKRVTFHMARHTFATTITLAQGMGIETISKLLGHKNIRTTQIYAAVTHSQLRGELERLSRRLDAQYRGPEEFRPRT